MTSPKLSYTGKEFIVVEATDTAWQLAYFGLLHQLSFLSSVVYHATPALCVHAPCYWGGGPAGSTTGADNDDPIPCSATRAKEPVAKPAKADLQKQTGQDKDSVAADVCDNVHWTAPSTGKKKPAVHSPKLPWTNFHVLTHGDDEHQAADDENSHCASEASSRKPVKPVLDPWGADDFGKAFIEHASLLPKLGSRADPNGTAHRASPTPKPSQGTLPWYGSAPDPWEGFNPKPQTRTNRPAAEYRKCNQHDDESQSDLDEDEDEDDESQSDLDEDSLDNSKVAALYCNVSLEQP
jgi:hypothetical protein